MGWAAPSAQGNPAIRPVDGQCGGGEMRYGPSAGARHPGHPSQILNRALCNLGPVRSDTKRQTTEAIWNSKHISSQCDIKGPCTPYGVCTPEFQFEPYIRRLACGTRPFWAILLRIELALTWFADAIPLANEINTGWAGGGDQNRLLEMIREVSKAGRDMLKVESYDLHTPYSPKSRTRSSL
ncbi:hypothetical protein CIHG_06428 [Coccidioides immitis H538.4]|uniref:Uncharacterized protein n=1 Tax=Coccidioides immitis H538.4 TaxID=396776 RepID=A0A0J8RUC0_COCIT|nr:hypothetical protein CIHG_06428 [Coccidioides immitis H538.4]